HNPLPGRVVFLATNGLVPSLDLKDHGIFARVLLDGLKGKADKEGGEADGLITIDELTEYLDKELPELARLNGNTKEEKQQRVFVIGGENTRFILSNNPDKAVARNDRVVKFQDLVKSGKVPAQFEAEGVALLTRMPRLEAQRKLRKEYQAL